MKPTTKNQPTTTWTIRQLDGNRWTAVAVIGGANLTGRKALRTYAQAHLGLAAEDITLCGGRTMTPRRGQYQASLGRQVEVAA